MNCESEYSLICSWILLLQNLERQDGVWNLEQLRLCLLCLSDRSMSNKVGGLLWAQVNVSN